jgi:hypothetical protein
LALVLLAGAAGADPLPYRLWWSFPDDDVSAIEIDEPDLRGSAYGSRWQLALALQKRCPHVARPPDGTPMREVRLERLDGDGAVKQVRRCVAPLAQWRTRIGARLVERLNDELDAHLSFLIPRKIPKPQTTSESENENGNGNDGGKK